MARSETAWIVGAIAVATSCVACADLLGLGDYGSCGDGCDSGAEAAEAASETGGGAFDAGIDGMVFDAGDAAPIEASLYWVRWPMPNPRELADEAGLPNPSSYAVDVATGVVTDLVTHLQWQLTTIAAGDDCAAMFGPAWRLPTRIELVSLIDFATQRPALDPVFVPDGGALALSVAFATGSSNDAGPWVVDFTTGEVRTTGAAQRARCVAVGP